MQLNLNIGSNFITLIMISKICNLIDRIETLFPQNVEIYFLMTPLMASIFINVINDFNMINPPLGLVIWSILSICFLIFLCFFIAKLFKKFLKNQA